MDQPFGDQFSTKRVLSKMISEEHWNELLVETFDKDSL